jgi:hypothetical protein
MDPDGRMPGGRRWGAIDRRVGGTAARDAETAERRDGGPMSRRGAWTPWLVLAGSLALSPPPRCSSSSAPGSGTAPVSTTPYRARRTASSAASMFTSPPCGGPRPCSPRTRTSPRTNSASTSPASRSSNGIPASRAWAGRVASSTGSPASPMSGTPSNTSSRWTSATAPPSATTCTASPSAGRPCGGPGTGPGPPSPGA